MAVKRTRTFGDAIKSLNSLDTGRRYKSKPVGDHEKMVAIGNAGELHEAVDVENAPETVTKDYLKEFEESLKKSGHISVPPVSVARGGITYKSSSPMGYYSFEDEINSVGVSDKPKKPAVTAAQQKARAQAKLLREMIEETLEGVDSYKDDSVRYPEVFMQNRFLEGTAAWMQEKLDALDTGEKEEK